MESSNVPIAAIPTRFPHIPRFVLPRPVMICIVRIVRIPGKRVNYLNTSPGSIGFAEAVPTIRDGERPFRRDRSANPVAFAFGRFLEVRDHVFRGIRSLVLLEQREVALPDTFDPWRLRDSLIVLRQRRG